MVRSVICRHQWTLRAFAWCVVLALALTPSMAATAASSIPASNMTLLGLLGGSMTAVTVDGSHAYIGQGMMVVVMDVTDPTQPKPLGQSGFLPGDVKAIAAGQDYAYAALGVEGLAVIDANNVAKPVLVTVIDTPGSAEDVAVMGSHILVANGLAGLRIYDVSDPTQPTPSGVINTPGFTQKLVIDGTTAYLADGRGGLRIVDVTTPDTPVELGVFDTPADVSGVAYGNNYAYIVETSTSTLRVIDVADRAHPFEESVITTDYSTNDVVLAGGYLYLGVNGSILRILNSDPFLLNQVGAWESIVQVAWELNIISDVAVAGGYAFVTNWGAGLYVLDVNPPAAVAEVGRAPSLHRVSVVAAANNVAYVPDDSGRIGVLDVSQPAQIAQKTSITPCQNAWHQMVIAGNTLVIDSMQTYSNWTANRQLCFYSLTDPLAPQQAGYRDATTFLQYSPRIATQGKRIFVASDGAIELNPDDLTGAPLGAYTPAPVNSLAALATGDRLLATTGSSILIIDVSTPATPQLLGELAGPYDGPVHGRGDLAFAYNLTTNALDIIDIHTPASPQVLASMELPGDRVKRILPAGNLVLIANGSAGVRVIDLSTPTAPNEVAFYDPPADVSEVVLEGNRVYAAANAMGLMVLQIDEDILPEQWTMSLPLLVREP